MTDPQPLSDHPTRQAIAVKDRSLPGRVTGKVKIAIDDMVWNASRRDDAALAAGLSVHGLREALRRPHVMTYYREQCELLRESGRARGYHRLHAIIEQDDNRQAAVNAAKALYFEQSSAQAGVGRAQMQTPGFIVQVINMQPGSGPVSDPTNGAHLTGQDRSGPKPLIEHTSVSSASENDRD